MDAAVAAAARWDGRANVYVTLNPANDALLARAVNHILERADATCVPPGSPRATTSNSAVERYTGAFELLEPDIDMRARIEQIVDNEVRHVPTR